MKLSRRVTVMVAAGSVIAVAACGPLDAGAAVVYNGGRVTENEVAAQVDELSTDLGLAPSARMTQFTVQRVVTNILIQSAADEVGVSATAGESEAWFAQASEASGGAAQLISGAAQQGIPASQVGTQVRIRVLADKIGDKLMPGAESNARDLVVGEYLVGVAKNLNLNVSPRFGTWYPDRLTVGPPPNDLSEPAPAQSQGLPGQLVVPQQ